MGKPIIRVVCQTAQEYENYCKLQAELARDGRNFSWWLRRVIAYDVAQDFTIYAAIAEEDKAGR